MLDPAKSFDTRTVVLDTVGGDLLRASLALTHQAKNLFNTANYLVRQVLSAYGYDAERKVHRLQGDLHPAQRAVLDHVNARVDAINGRRRAKHPEKLDKALRDGRKPPDLKLVPQLEDEVDSPFATMLEVTVLDNAVRTWPNEDGEFVYRRLPAAMAQQIVWKLVDAYKGYAAGVKAFRTDPSAMTGRPKMPGYLDKHERFVLEIPFAQIKDVSGTLPEPKETRIPEDDFAPERSFLTPEMLRAFYDCDLVSAVANACRKRKWVNAQPQHLRIVPLRKSVRFEAVVRIPNPYPEDSFLARTVERHGADLAKLKDDKARESWLVGHLGALAADRLPRLAGIDLGKTNMATVAYSTGHRAAVHTGGRFTAMMEWLTGRIADRIAAITPQRAKDLQARKTALRQTGEKLSRGEEMELRSLLKAVHEDDEYRRLVAKKNRWSDDYLHKLSTHIVRACADRRIDVIVVGRNKGWKQEIDLGTKQNRTFCQIAHARLIGMIRYKADALGIAVVETEESYTSKTSFVNDETLETYGQKTRSAAAQALPVTRTGVRSSVDRNWFHHKNRTDRWEWVHTDVNGAFNIVRKVFRSFAHHAGLTLKFTLMRVSPRLGVTPLALPQAAA